MSKIHSCLETIDELVRQALVEAPGLAHLRLDHILEETKAIRYHLGDFSTLFPTGDIDSTLTSTATREQLILGMGPLAETPPEVGRWAKEFRQLDQAEPHQLAMSYDMSTRLGFKPKGKPENWIAMLHDYWEQADQNITVFYAGVSKAGAARDDDGLTLTARSLGNFIEAAAAEANTPSKEKPGRITL